MKSLPIGFQSIKDIIEQGFTYVDKTGILYELVREKGVFFLSRPRRFGKSLTCSTLEAIFQGKKELFKGLAISKTDYDWKPYPIVRLDFNGIAHQTLDDFHISLSLELKRVAAGYGLDISQATLPKDQFKILILGLAQKHGPVAVIIDEYDKPILDHIYNEDTAIQMRSFMKSFYGALKDADVDANLRFLFLTGVSKFSKVSIFSELNNLKDLTLEENMATLCGWTQEELEAVFDEHIKDFAQKKNKTKQELLAELKNWYNGFKFSKNGTKVYNPFSILNCLSSKDFRNFWFASGTPTFIMKFVEHNPDLVKKLIMLESSKIAAAELETFSIESYFENMLILFLQSGYLTISTYNPKSEVYQLNYPNYEVRRSMTEQILKYIAHIELVDLGEFVERFQNALSDDDINAFCAAMKDFFVLLPHTVITDREKFYQGVFFTVTKLIGGKIDAEQATSCGYIDVVLEGKNRTYVIEFKKDRSPDAALKQIEDKEYFAKFKIEGKAPITLVGMNFKYSSKSGVTINWKIKEI